MEIHQLKDEAKQEQDGTVYHSLLLQDAEVRVLSNKYIEGATSATRIVASAFLPFRYYRAHPQYSGYFFNVASIAKQF